MVGLRWRGPLLYRLAQSVAANGGEPPEEEMRDLTLAPAESVAAIGDWLCEQGFVRTDSRP